MTSQHRSQPDNAEAREEMLECGIAEAFEEADFAILYREIEDSGTTTLQEITNVPQVWCQQIAHQLRAPAQCGVQTGHGRICCYCDAPLSCAVCGVEQPDDPTVSSAMRATPTYCAHCDHEHQLHEDAQGFHHVIRGERVACCSVPSTDRA